MKCPMCRSGEEHQEPQPNGKVKCRACGTIFYDGTNPLTTQ